MKTLSSAFNALLSSPKASFWLGMSAGPSTFLVVPPGLMLPGRSDLLSGGIPFSTAGSSAPGVWSRASLFGRWVKGVGETRLSGGDSVRVSLFSVAATALITELLPLICVEAGAAAPISLGSIGETGG